MCQGRAAWWRAAQQVYPGRMAAINVTVDVDPMDRRVLVFSTGRTEALAWSFDHARDGGGRVLAGPNPARRYPVDGTYTVDVIAPNGDQGSATFVVGPATAPEPPEPPRQVDVITPNVGPVGGGTVVHITGAGLTGATGVKFGPSQGTAFSVVADSTIQVTNPSRPAGVEDVTVQHPSGNLDVVGGFTYE
jgi:hypothetical protein